MKKKFEALHHAHDPVSIQERLQGGSKSMLRDFVYGAIDGAVTTFAIVAGVAGAQLEARTILILGSANILADGFSMAASNYLATKSELEEMKLVTLYEQDQIKHNPEGEAEEVRQIFLKKGIEGEALETVVSTIVANKQEWLNLMLAEEYGFSTKQQVPWKAGLVTFTSFMLFGLIPLIPYILSFSNSFNWAIAFTGFAFFVSGATKSRWTMHSFWYSGMETLFIGSLAAAMAYYVGVMLG